MINIDEREKADYQAGGRYNLNGGTLDLAASAALIGFGEQSSAYVTVGNAGGTIDVDLRSSIWTGLSCNYEYIINVQNTPPTNLVINFNLGAWGKKVTYTYSNGFTTIAIKVTGGFVFTASITVYIVIPGNPNGFTPGVTKQYYFANDGSGSIVIRCFAAGTSIKTPDGEVLVEQVVVGQTVTIIRDGREQSERVVWVGQRTVEGERLVIVKQNAFGEGRPYRDLRITQEHCIFVEGNFIPARLLVNERSIYFDLPRKSTVYHLETTSHSVLVANGLEAESFLDTNPFSYDENISGNSIVIGTPRHSWERDAAAVLNTELEFVKNIHCSLVERAEYLQFPLVPKEARILTDDPLIKIILPSGEERLPLRQRGDRYVFNLPQNTARVLITSRSFQPNVTVAPYIDDRRELGVLIGGITLFAPTATHSVTQHLDVEMLVGWHVRENSMYRWTEGAGAELPLLIEECSDHMVMSVQVLAGGPYLI